MCPIQGQTDTLHTIAQTDTVHIIALDCALFLDIHFTFTHTAPICVQCNVRLRHYTPIYTTNLHQYTPINNNIHQYVSIAMCVSYTMQCNAMCVYVRQYARLRLPPGVIHAAAAALLHILRSSPS